MLKGDRATPSLILFSRVQRPWNCKNILCGRECTVPLPDGRTKTSASWYRGFRAQRFYLNLLPVLVFFTPFDRSRRARQACDVSFSNFATQESYRPSKNGAICVWAYLLCAQRFYRSAVFDRTFVQTLTALCVADRSGTKVLCANFIANPVLHRAQRFYLQR